MMFSGERKRVLQNHILHPEHPLKIYSRPFAARVRAALERRDLDATVVCDGCMTHLTGPRYRCHPCDFDLHPACARPPRSLRSPLHAPHALSLFVKSSCGVCSKLIKDTPSYRCQVCALDFHARCLDAVSPAFGFPPSLSSAAHPQHELARLRPRCNACSLEIQGSIFYRCEECDFGVHPFCCGVELGKGEIMSTLVGGSRYFFMHPEHKLSACAGHNGSGEDWWCEACGGRIEGGGECYGCARCGFHVHGECAAVEATVRDVTHPAHILYFQKCMESSCTVCKKSCMMGRYHCSLCDVHVHRGCLKGPPLA